MIYTYTAINHFDLNMFLNAVIRDFGEFDSAFERCARLAAKVGKPLYFEARKTGKEEDDLHIRISNDGHISKKCNCYDEWYCETIKQYPEYKKNDTMNIPTIDVFRLRSKKVKKSILNRLQSHMILYNVNMQIFGQEREYENDQYMWVEDGNVFISNLCTGRKVTYNDLFKNIFIRPIFNTHKIQNDLTKFRLNNKSYYFSYENRTYYENNNGQGFVFVDDHECLHFVDQLITNNNSPEPLTTDRGNNQTMQSFLPIKTNKIESFEIIHHVMDIEGLM